MVSQIIKKYPHFRNIMGKDDRSAAHYDSQFMRHNLCRISMTHTL